MKSLLILRNLSVENANAISGLTWGFPAVSNFLGFTHGMSRKLEDYAGFTLGGCAVICHHHSVQAYQPAGWGDYVFALTRNPLTKNATSPSFVEEGRMHMQVTLLIECDFTAEDLDFGGESHEAEVLHLEHWFKKKIFSQRLAGGTITSAGIVSLQKLPQQHEKYKRFERKTLLQVLPGFALVDRSNLLQQHHEQRVQSDAEAQLIDSWLDFISMRHQAQKNSETDDTATWERVPKPSAGWLVPISTGYRAISPLYPPGEVKRTRDPNMPFRFAEAVYGIGEWVSPHRVQSLNSLFWRYQHNDDWYLCKNDYSNEITEVITESKA